MAVFTHSDPQPGLFRDSVLARTFSNAFDRMVKARSARVNAEVAQHLAAMKLLDSDRQALSRRTSTFDVDAAIVGKKGVYAWPY